MNKLVTNKHNFSVFSYVREWETDQEALERARAYYQESIARYEEIIADQGNGKDDYWLNCLNKSKKEMETLQIETEEAYRARVRDGYLTPPAKETTEEHYWDMLEVLPPCAFTSNARYEMFYVSEAYDLTYHSFYLHDKTIGKYWEKLCDAKDRSTWIDVALGLRAA
jgi:hypothetical protein